MEPSSKNHDFVRLTDGRKLFALFEDIFTDKFMARFTRFQGFDGFCYSSAVIVNWNADTLIYSKTLLDSFVRESTDFSDWDEMVRKATQLRFHCEE